MTDVFITLLTLGREGYQNLLQQRKDAYVYLQEKLAAVAAAHGEQVLNTRGNPISLAMTLSTVARDLTLAGKDVTFFGSMLFTRCVSGTRYALSLVTRVCFAGVPRPIVFMIFAGKKENSRSLSKRFLNFHVTQTSVVSGTTAKEIGGVHFKVSSSAIATAASADSPKRAFICLFSLILKTRAMAPTATTTAYRI